MGKGKKDRFVTLPQASLLAMRKYWSTHRNPSFIFPMGKNKRTTSYQKTINDRGGLQKLIRVIYKD